MLREIKKVRQDQKEKPKRWFSSPAMDLIVRIDDKQKIISFELLT